MRVLKGQLKKHLSTSESSYLSSDSLVFKGPLSSHAVPWKVGIFNHNDSPKVLFLWRS